MPRGNRNLDRKEFRYPFCVAPAGEGWTIWFPDLPGCRGWAETLELVGKEAETVLGLWIETEVDQQHPIPEPSGAWIEATWSDEAFSVDELSEPELLTVRDMAERLGVSVRRVHQLATDRNVGRIIGGARIFMPSDVEALTPRRAGRPRVSDSNRSKLPAAP